MSKRFYLETSVIRSRLFGHSSIRTHLIKKLEGSTKITSPYIKMEFERGFICSLIEFYFDLKKHTSIHDASVYWAEDFSKRKLKNIYFSITPIFIGIKNDSDIKRALLNLRNEIKKIISLFSRLINRFDKNETACYCSNFRLDLDSNTVEDVENSFVEFYQHYYKYNYAGNCKVVDFFDNKKEILKRIKEYSSKEAGYIQQQANLAKLFNKDISCGSCGTVGDTIIALECPDYAILLSLDSVFADLCKVIGIKCEIIDSVRKMNPLDKVLERLRIPREDKQVKKV